MLIYIIRHGETRLNEEGKLQGWVDEPLNDKGRELAQVTAEALKEIPFDLLYTSPLSRAKETGLIVTEASARYHGREIPVIEDRRLMEYRWGSWDCHGCLPDNYSVPTSMENYNRFFADSFRFQPAEDGETFQDVIKRTGEFFQELIHDPELQDKTILISTHGVATRSLLNPYYEDPMNFWHGQVPPNCSVNKLEVKDGEVRILEEDQIYYDPSLVHNPYMVVEE
ncbi:MAG: histidine phosphatase family protein [Eubacterium sp.]|nr:histidine phosphatase family protein [Eubacterium sp.]